MVDEKRKRSLWTLAALAATTLVVVATSTVVLDTPRLEPDDYRYLELIREQRSDPSAGLLDALVVENRWDHLWWMNAAAPVRFFRPTIVLSYWVDDLIHRQRDRGLLLTNLLIHLVCCWLAWVLLSRLLGPGVVSLLGALLFAAFYCHGEVLWYVAGRTDSLAAAGFLAALAVHVCWAETHPRRVYLALPCFGVALLSKELAIGLPLLALAHDAWGRRETGGAFDALRARAGVYVGYAGVGLAYLGLRSAALARGDAGTGWVFPYLVSPTRSDFPGHLWAQVRSHAENLFAAQATVPFLQADQLAEKASLGAFALAAAGTLALVIAGWRDRRFHFFVCMALLTWLPTSVAYVSERYLYLPSLALAGATAAAVERLRGNRTAHLVALALVAVWGLHQGYRLHQKLAWFAHWPHRDGAVIEQLFSPLRDHLPDGARLLVLNFPLDWVAAQFLQPTLRTQLEDPALEVRVLTFAPTGVRGEAVDLIPIDSVTLAVRGKTPLLDRADSLFPWISFQPGTVVDREELGFSARVVEGDGATCSAVEFRFTRPFDSYVLVGFVPGAGGDRRERVLSGRMQIVSGPGR